MFFCVLLSFLFGLSTLTLLSNFHRLCILEATDRCGATLLLNGGGSLSHIMTAILYGKIRLRFYQGVDTNISIPSHAYQSADASHPQSPYTQDWEELNHAALSSTREMIERFKHNHGPDEGTHLYTFIQSIALSTFLHLFFRLPITSTNIEEVIWITSNTWRMDDTWKQPVGNPPELCRLVKPSPNPSGVLALLLATQRLILAAICILEGRGENLRFLRQAETILHHPASPDSAVTRLVEGVTRTHPPFQSVHGGLSLSYPPLRWTCRMNFFIPVDLLPPSACMLGPDGACVSWLHKAGIPAQPACGSDTWLVHAVTIILSAIEMEIRRANLTVDGDRCDSEAWEEWILRRLKVG